MRFGSQAIAATNVSVPPRPVNMRTTVHRRPGEVNMPVTLIVSPAVLKALNTSNISLRKGAAPAATPSPNSGTLKAKMATLTIPKAPMKRLMAFWRMASGMVRPELLVVGLPCSRVQAKSPSSAKAVVLMPPPWSRASRQSS